MTREEQLALAQDALIKGDRHVAESLYQEVLRGDAGNLRALDGMGILRCAADDAENALRYFEEALCVVAQTEADGLTDNDADSTAETRGILLFHAGLALRSLGRQDEALKALRESTELNPHEPAAFLNAGQIHFEQGDHEAALLCFEKLVALEPENPSAWLTLGYLHTLAHRYHESIPALLEAEHLDPTSPEACFYLAEALRFEERFEESLPYYRKMLQVGTEWPHAVSGYGKSLLALGQLGDAWDALEFRLAGSFGSWERHLLPSWDGTEQTKTVLAYSEEGIGADILFASCLPDMIDRVDHCVVECEQSLHGLFARSFPEARFVPLAQDRVDAANSWNLSLDAQIALGSLPRYFRRDAESFPLRKAYLVPDQERVERWSNKLAEIGDVAKIGVVWQGSWTAETKDQVSLPMPELRDLMLQHIGDAAWICLQHGSKQKEIDQYRRGVSLQVRLYPDAFKYDLDEMAALMTSLDLVVTPPGFAAHLAGALGVKTWLVLPARADWRWNVNREYESACLWHPTMQVYRQRIGQSWADLFRNLGGDLGRFLANRHSPEEGMPEILSFPVRNVERLSTPTKRSA